MTNFDWLITAEGQCETCGAHDDFELPQSPYRLYRFLTDLEDIVAKYPDDHSRLQAIFPLVRRLLISSDWLQGEYLEPDPKTGWSVLMLYDEPDFPLTVQTVVWAPGQSSPIHNHAAWGIVALISGQEKNTLWRRVEPSTERIEQTGDRILNPGDIIGFVSDAIHQVEALGDEPTVSFNVYGATNYSQRFEYDAIAQTAKLF